LNIKGIVNEGVGVISTSHQSKQKEVSKGGERGPQQQGTKDLTSTNGHAVGVTGEKIEVGVLGVEVADV